MWVSFSIPGPGHLFGHGGEFDLHHYGAAGFDAAAAADFAVSLSGVHVADVEECAGVVDG